MKRGELYRVKRPTKLYPKGFRIFVIVSRQDFIESNYKSVICAAIYTNRNGLESEVNVGIDGLKHESAIRCDELLSIPKYNLTHFIGSLSEQRICGTKSSLKNCTRIKIEK